MEDATISSRVECVVCVINYMTFHDSLCMNRSKKKSLPSWSLTLNVDGYSKGNPGMAGAGGIIRDHMGTWVGGFARNIGYCSSITAKLWAIYVGLHLT